MSYLTSIIISCLLLASMIACKKDDKYTATAQGRVIEAATGKPIEGARVRLQDGVGNSGPINLGNTSSGINVETLTNANGEFNLKIEGEFSPYISTGKTKYHDFRYDGVGVMPLRTSNNSNIILSLESEAYFNATFVSKNNLKIDTLVVSLLSYKNKIGVSDVNLFIGNEPHTYSISGFYSYGNRYLPMRLYIVRNGKAKINIDSVYLKPFETYSDTIYY